MKSQADLSKNPDFSHRPAVTKTTGKIQRWQSPHPLSASACSRQGGLGTRWNSHLRIALATVLHECRHAPASVQSSMKTHSKDWFMLARRCLDNAEGVLTSCEAWFERKSRRCFFFLHVAITPSLPFGWLRDSNPHLFFNREIRRNSRCKRLF